MTTFRQVLGILSLTSKLEINLTTSDDELMTLTMDVDNWFDFLKDNSWSDYRVLLLYAEDKNSYVLKLVEFHGCTKCGSKNCHGDLC